VGTDTHSLIAEAFSDFWSLFPEKPMNIVLIIVDTLRYDYVAANGNARIQTPNLDRLIRRSWNFHRAFAASFPTIPHRTDVMTGRYGAPFHVSKPLDCDKPTIPWALADLGYCTQLIHDTPHLVNGGHSFDFPFHAWTPVRGAEVDRGWITDRWELLSNWRFDPLFDPFPRDLETVLRKNHVMRGYVHTNHGRQREEDWNVARLLTTAARFLRDNRRRNNFFLWLDCFDPHEPWDAPPEYVRLYDPGNDGLIDPRSLDGKVMNRPSLSPQARARIAAQYAAKVTFMDKWLGVFLDTLNETGLAERTAVVLTADHGTNVGGPVHPFGKVWPPRTNEARVPFVLHVPGAGSGESGMLVQPQDIFATLMGIAGGRPPVSIESVDVLKAAQQTGSGPRSVALCGTAVGQWRPRGADQVLFTAFDHDWALGFAAKPDRCELRRLGTEPDVAPQHPDIVARLREAAIGELLRRGLDTALWSWLRSEGRTPFPDQFSVTDAHPAPAGWRHYFHALYHGE